MKNILYSVSRVGLSALIMSLLVIGSVFAQDFIQGYRSEDTLLKGSLVSSSIDTDGNVVAANIDNINELLGVVVKSSDSAVTLTTDTAGVFVSTSGKYEVIVTDLNGSISAGDYITSSAIDGVGMLADSRHERVVARALQDLDISNPANVPSTIKVKTSGGEERVAALSRILVEIRVEDNPIAKGAIERAPAFILSFGETIAGKEVSPIRIYASLIVMLASLGIGGSMLYSTIKTSFVAIGRNPLAKSSVMTGLRQVVFVAILIFGVGFFAVYLILRL